MCIRFSHALLSPAYRYRPLKSIYSRINFFESIIKCWRNSYCVSKRVSLVEQRLGALTSRSYRYTHFIHKRSDIERMRTFDCKRYHASAFTWRPDNADTFDLRKKALCSLKKRMLTPSKILQIQRFQIVKSRRERDCPYIVGSSRLKTQGRPLEGSVRRPHNVDHLPTERNGR